MNQSDFVKWRFHRVGNVKNARFDSVVTLDLRQAM